MYRLGVGGRGRSAYSVDGVQLPVGLQVLEAQRVDVLVDDQGDLDPKVHDHQALCADLEGHDLDRVADQQARPGQGVAGAEEPDEGDDGLAGGLVLVFLVRGRADGPTDEAEQHAQRGGQEERAPAYAVAQQRAAHRHDQRPDHLPAVEAQLRVGVGDANRLVDVGRVVRHQAVAGPLREQAQRRHQEEAVSVAPGFGEVEVAGGLLREELEAQGLANLGVFKLHRRVRAVAVGVVLGQDSERFVRAILGDQPSWRLRDEPDAGDLDQGRSALHNGGDAPRPVRSNVLGAE